MQQYGTYTKADLTDLAWYEAASQGLPDRQAARFGLELAQLAYDFELSPWLAAGWTDATIQVDQRLISGLRSTEEASGWYQQTMNLLLPRLAKGLKNMANPVADLRAYLQAHKEPQTGKAVVLLRQEEGLRFTVAIGFMGTGRRPQDWAPNMCFQQVEGFHQGFARLAEQFSQKAASIRFPTAALALGRQELSLADVLAAAQEADSPFRLVVAGHSQGAAVMQVWAYQQLDAGLAPARLAALGYASPMVAAKQPKAINTRPIINFLCSDDIFPRMGMRHHVGNCYLLKADQAFRSACYGQHQEDALFLQVLGIFSSLRNTQEGLLFALGFLEALSQRPRKAIGSSLAAFVESPWLESLADLPVLAEEWTERLMRLTLRSFRKFYADAVGEPPLPEAVAGISQRAGLLMDQYGAVHFSQALVKALYLTHSLVGHGPYDYDKAPYSYLVVRGFDQLVRLQEAEISTGEGLPAQAGCMQATDERLENLS